MKIALIAAVVLLAGCSGSHPATLALPTAVASPPSTTSDDLKASAETFVRAYYAALGQSLSAGSTIPVSALMTSTCPCRGFVTTVDRILHEGKHFDPSRYLLRSVVVLKTSRDQGALVEVRYDFDQETIRDPAGVVVEQFPERRNEVVSLSLVHSPGGWLVANAVGVQR